MANVSGADLDAELVALNDKMAQRCLTPTWAFYKQLVSPTPNVSYGPYLWKSELLQHVVEEASRLVDLSRGGERRSFEFVNPGLRHIHATTHSIGAALQLVKPGEIAPPHRHLANAIRFILKGRGSYTAVQGERLYMEERDLILTPSWMWHEHGNETDEPIVWLDALDYPLLNQLQLSFFDHGGNAANIPQRPLGYTAARLGFARPTWETYPEQIPMVTYKWSEVWATLDALRGETGSPHDGILLEYLNPLAGGSVLPTIACYAQLLRPHERTQAQRTTASKIYYVLDGEGHSVIGGQRFNWAAGDVFMVPPWAWHEHSNDTGGDAVFFALSDKPVLESLRVLRSEVYDDHQGHQAVNEQFTPLRWQ